MREANRLVSVVLDAIGEAIKPGICTMDLERIAVRISKEAGIRPAFLGLYGFPYALCCSINEEVVHGFPSEERILREGDIVSADFGVCYKNFYGDAARTWGVGVINSELEKLLSITEKSLYDGIAKAEVGNDLYAISSAIQKTAEDAGFGVVRSFVGHGIGTSPHEKPEVPNFHTEGSKPIFLKAGMTLSIEPMITSGHYDVEVLNDKWTVVTKDRLPSAHFEHTIAITSDGPIILSVS